MAKIVTELGNLIAALKESGLSDEQVSTMFSKGGNIPFKGLSSSDLENIPESEMNIARKSAANVQKYQDYFNQRFGSPSDLGKLGDVKLNEASRKYIADVPKSSVIPGPLASSSGVSEFTPREFNPNALAKTADEGVLIKPSKYEMATRHAARVNPFEMVEGPSASSVASEAELIQRQLATPAFRKELAQAEEISDPLLEEKNLEKLSKNPKAALRYAQSKQAKVDKIIEQEAARVAQEEAAKAAEKLASENATKAKAAAEAAAKATEAAEETAFRAKLPSAENVKPIYANALEEQLDNLQNLPKSIKDKLVSSGSKIGGLISKGLKPLGPIGAAVSTAEASNEFQQLFDNDNLTTKQKIGKGLKGVGGTAMAASVPMEIMSAGFFTPAAMATGLTGAGMYGLGSYLDPEMEQPTPTSAPVPAPALTSAPKVPGVNVIKDLTDEEINKEVERAASGEQPMSFAPEKQKVIDIYKKVAGEEGLNPNLLLGQAQKESGLESGITVADRTSSATGLGQLTKGAYADVQNENKEFKNISFDELNKPENAELQAKAHAKYFKKLLKANDGNEEFAVRKYFQGGYSNEDYRGFAADESDEYGRPLVEKIDNAGNVLTVEEQKRKLMRRGYDGPDADEYVKDVFNNKKQFELAEETPVDREPSSVPNEKLEALRRLRLALTTEDPASLKEGDKALLYGPSSDAAAYSQNLKDRGRLDAAKAKYGALMAAKQTPEEPSDEVAKTAFEPEEKTAFSAIKSKPEIMPMMLQALRSKGDIEGYTNLMRGLNQAMHGAFGVGSKTKIENVTDKLLEDQGKLAGEGVKDLTDMLKINEYEQTTNPNSEKAQSFRDLLKNTFNIDVASIQNLSYNEMKELFSPLATMTKAERDYVKNKEKQDMNTLLKFRGEFASGPAGKALETYRKTRKATNLLGQALKNPALRTGAGDIGSLFSFLKTMQSDESVIKEAEMKLGMSMGGFSDEMKAKFIKFFRGGIFTDQTRKAMYDTLKLQNEAAKKDFEEQAAPILKHMRRMNVDPKEINTFLQDMTGERSESRYDENTKKLITQFMKTNNIEDRDAAIKILEDNGYLEK